MSNEKSAAGYRVLEIILGIFALAVGILALIYPTITVVTLVVLFGIALIAVGILRLATAYTSQLPDSARSSNAVIGVIALIVGLLVVFFPEFATISLTILIGIGLLIYAIGRLVVGGAATNLNGALRALIILFGILVAVFALIVIFFPVVGIFTYAFFVSLALILIGMDSIASGIVGIPLT
ncbi:MAG: DUF308 domain-containing protein [Candidatus Bathyarchaeota archaeon]|nr:DUF308 domain-containing protein [Candidatus Bathyarchaeota archaeon]